MIPRECKRQIEVDLPVAVVSKHPVNEKSIRHGHGLTLQHPFGTWQAVKTSLDPIQGSAVGKSVHDGMG